MGGNRKSKSAAKVWFRLAALRFAFSVSSHFPQDTGFDLCLSLTVLVSSSFLRLLCSSVFQRFCRSLTIDLQFLFFSRNCSIPRRCAFAFSIMAILAVMAILAIGDSVWIAALLAAPRCLRGRFWFWRLAKTPNPKLRYNACQGRPFVLDNRVPRGKDV